VAGPGRPADRSEVELGRSQAIERGAAVDELVGDVQLRVTLLGVGGARAAARRSPRRRSPSSPPRSPSGGCSAIAPGVMRAAGPSPVRLAAVTSIGYFGSFTGPALIGGLAHLVGLQTALLVVAMSALAISAFAREPVRCRRDSVP
jgi:hypothetical protein